MTANASVGEMLTSYGAAMHAIGDATSTRKSAVLNSVSTQDV
eukprot:CAMPEP_0206399912 /NCGR_PEP_ID=MMETSP0294-20121207/25167_1 /ASSEMBLY_ACC=CAM_ASM_000327 /TAXON_ID=39354 /ORGANISM="Heterosigma akashiwo, Strain CCMP2393" /LENGTH=41 /DNA_ID= /DNA_START= /DNA_END= /DNA_ORIENTATION=